MGSEKKDRISKYLVKGNSEMVFGELSDSFMQAMGAQEILRGIPVPIGQGSDGQIAVKDIVLDMARVIGGDPDFVYARPYLEYIRSVAGDQAEPVLVSAGAAAADDGRYEDACRLLRTALAVDPQSRAALYLYGRACKACYEIAGEESSEGISLMTDEEAREYIGSFKAEALDIFEVLTMLHPEFAMGYYFLGYGYLNLGLYLKAKLTWDDFMKLSSSADPDAGIDDGQMEDLRHEISGMLLDLEEPVEIEKGCNRIMAGDFAGGKDILHGGRYGIISGQQNQHLEILKRQSEIYGRS